MGHRERLKSGDEWDCFSQRARRLVFWRSKQRKSIKSKFNRRIRKNIKQRLENET